jgi:threonine dehydratase/serine racemase
MALSGYTSTTPTRANMTQYSATFQDVLDAAKRIAVLTHRTPVTTCATLDRLAGRSLFFKGEHLQKSGAFKFRGACNATRKLPPEMLARGVVTHSSGNHAGALALVARMQGVPAHIVMPRNASAVKRRAVQEYGGHVIDCEPTSEAREQTAAAVVAETGGTLIPPHDHPDIIAGQGTAALELLEEVPDLDAVVAPVGGGGLVSGVCVAAKGVRPSIRVFAAEPAGADDAARSKAAGVLIPQRAPRTIADGLLTSLGEHNWPIIRDQVERVITVSEEEIVAAMRLVWERAKLLIEPSSAVAVAAVLSPSFGALEGLKRVGVVLSGGNVNLDDLPW